MEIRVCSAKKKCKLKKWCLYLKAIFNCHFAIQNFAIYYIHHQADHLSSKSHPSSVFPELFSSRPENWNLFYTQLSLSPHIWPLKKYILFWLFKSIWLQHCSLFSLKNTSVFWSEPWIAFFRDFFISPQISPNFKHPGFPSVSDLFTPFSVHGHTCYNAHNDVITCIHTKGHTMHLYYSVLPVFPVLSWLCA